MPTTHSLSCPKCGDVSLSLVLKTSWGEYYACAPCQWSIFSAETRPQRIDAGSTARVLIAAAASSKATPASSRNTAA